jgi:exosome complex component RRP42
MKQRIDHMERYFSQNIKYNGKGLDEFQDLIIEKDISSTAEGSVKVTLGDTVVLAGVKLEVGTPYPDTPDQGGLMVDAQLMPLASPDFEPGPPSENAIEIARVIDRGIREGGVIDVKKLCITKGEKSWTVIVDLIPINAGGNLLDVFGIAAMAALMNTTFPEFDGEQIDYKKKTNKKLPVEHIVVPITSYKYKEYLFVDPSITEEKESHARITISTNEDDTIVAMQKGGYMPITSDDVLKAVDNSIKIGKQIRDILKKEFK